MDVDVGEVQDPEAMTEVPLRDGSRVWIRPIRPADRAHLERGMTWLSPRSRYLRFHSHVEKLSATQLRYLTEVDHVDHEALIAIDPDVPGRPGVGVGRYIRLAEDPTVAEAAITVVDDHQGRGIGTALIGLLEPLAHRRGITTFRNYVLAENRSMIEIFRQLDGEFTSEGGSVYRVDVPVPDPAGAQPDTPAGRWVTEMARHHRADEEPGSGPWAYPVMWFLRRLGVGAPPDDTPLGMLVDQPSDTDSVNDP